MNSSQNNTPDLRTRLIAFLLVLAVGAVMGWINGGSKADPASTGIVASAQGEAGGADDEAAQADAAAADQDAGVADDAPAASSADDASSASTANDGSTDTQDDSGAATVAPTRGPTVEEDGWYTSKEEVALYIHSFGHLPGNFISKTKARDRGWIASEGNLDEVCPGMSIGGSRFYNDEGALPDKHGRTWTECDINYHGGRRGAERIVFSNDGLVYYTGDHYQTFERLY